MECTPKNLLDAACRASDEGVLNVGLYVPAIRQARLKKNGDVTITITLTTRDFSIEDIASGMRSVLVIGTKSAFDDLRAQIAAMPEPSV